MSRVPLDTDEWDRWYVYQRDNPVLADLDPPVQAKRLTLAERLKRRKKQA